MKRKEIVLQRDITDCGPCCLSSIINHFDGYVPLEKIRLDTYADNRGTSAYNLISAAKNYGFDGAGLKLKNIDDITSFPCIAHVVFQNGLNHYIVIYGIKKHQLLIMDPSKGKVIMTKKEFNDIWDNIIIKFQPKHQIIKYPVQNNIIGFLITLLNLLSNFYFKIGNSVFNTQNSFILIFFLFIIVIIIKNSFYLLYSNSYINLNSKIHKSLVSDFTTHIFSLPSIILQNKTSGEIVTRINELNDIEDLLSKIVIGFVLDGLLVINSGIILLFINRQISLVVFITLLLYFLVSLTTAKRINYKLIKWINKDTEYNEVLLDAIDMYPSINHLQVKNEANENLIYHLDEKIHEDKGLKKYLNRVNFVKSLIIDIAIIILNTMAIILIFQNKMTMVNYIIYNTIYIYLFNSFENILNILPEYYYLKNTIIKISEFKNLETEKEEGIKEFSYGSLKIKDLSYQYNDNNILNNINYNFKKGQDYFLFGPSGSGKSTFLKILYKDISKYKGNITIDDINYKDIKTSSLKENITFVNQSEKLFSGTIYQNIVCFRNISQTEFDLVCKICLIDKIASKKPLRYLSNVKDALTNLSGGEKQQIILARNLLKNGSIIIVDEALSEVDIDTETTIIENIRKFYKEKTLIYVSHKDLRHLFNNSIRIN